VKRYNPKDIEPKWQKQWATDKVYEAVDFDDRQKYVMLTEFPYPSGAGIHIGHTREYTLGDIMARHKRMQGYNVLYPMGYDAFGLPTENYAIKNKVTPQQATDDNVATFQEQLETLGLGFDWSRSFRTSDPDYYKWTQWLFLQFFKKDLAYQDEIAINWCPFCKTGLANEEVVNGRHERCDTPVERKLLKQWMMRITAYADRLIEGLKDVDYPARIADQQINWIGRSKGAEVSFAIDGDDEKLTVFTTRADTLYGVTFMVVAPEHPIVQKITTPEHKSHVNSYIKTAEAKSDIERQENREKTGAFTGAYAINPLSGAKIPIWVADYVLYGYGTGAIMAVPAHDERDFAFARAFDLPITQVIAPEKGIKRDNEQFAEGGSSVVFDPKTQKYAFLQIEKNGNIALFAGGRNEGEDLHEGILRELREESGLTHIKHYEEACTVYGHYYHSLKDINRRARATVLLVVLDDTETVETQLEEHEKFHTVWLSAGEVLAKWKAADGGHYDHYIVALEQAVGRAIELGYDKTSDSNIFRTTAITGEGIMVNSGPYDEMESSEAREKIVADLEASGDGKERINYKLRDWIFSRQHYWGEPIPIIHCPKDGAVAVPDDQLPVTLPIVEHYEPTDTGESPLSEIADWVNVTCPTCGGPAKRETDTMPNWAGSSWYYLRYFDAHNDTAFASKDKLDYWRNVDMYLGGMEHTTLHLLYSRFWHQFFYDQGLVPTPEPYQARRGQGIILAADGTKMSKSKGNVVNPSEVIDSGYGADALRVAIAFIAPYDQTTPWSPEGVGGTFRFLQRVWNLAQDYVVAEKVEGDSEAMRRAVHRTIKRVSNDVANMGFNTAVAALMELTNEFYKLKKEVPIGSSVWKESLAPTLQLLAPFAPHMTEELWHLLGNEGSIHQSEWPKYDEKYLIEDTVTIAVQVNGKLRSTVSAPADSDEAAATELARVDAKVAGNLAGKQVVKTIYVPGKLLNFVVT
jgi:leucyl-tRNA synthetase